MVFRFNFTRITNFRLGLLIYSLTVIIIGQYLNIRIVFKFITFIETLEPTFTCFKTLLA
jgi:hypothetical protein